MVQPTTTNGDIASVESYEDEVNNLGDQDAENAGYQYPADAYTPTAQNVRRFPELFDQAVIDSFEVPDLDHQESTDVDEVDVEADDELDETTINEGDSNTGDGGTIRVTF